MYEYQNPYMQPQNNIPTFAYVNGYEDVKNFQLIMGRTALLMENQGNCFYVKSMNQMGQYIIKKYQFNEIPLEDTTPKYVTLDQFQALSTKIDTLLTAMKGGGGNGESNI